MVRFRGRDDKDCNPRRAVAPLPRTLTRARTRGEIAVILPLPSNNPCTPLRPLMQNYLVMSALGRNRPGLVDACSKSIKDCGCSIVDSRMAVLGGEFAMIMLLSGTWDAIAKIENILPRLEETLDVKIISRRTDLRKGADKLMPYAVEVVSMDHPGIVHDIAHVGECEDGLNTG